MIKQWRIDIDELSGYRFDSLGRLWKLPYTDNKGCSRGIRFIRMQYPSRWKIGDKWWSKNQLKSKMVLEEVPLNWFEDNLPF